MAHPLSPEERARGLRLLKAVETRLHTLLLTQPDELERMDALLSPAARVCVLLHIAVCIKASTKGRMTAEERTFWIAQTFRQIQGQSFEPFPFERHCNLLIKLVVKGCERRGELDLEQ